MARFLYVFFVVGVAIVAAQTNYNAGDSGRSETVNPDGSVSGQYSYTDPNGKLLTVKYRAGKDGYHVEGDHLPKAPSVPGNAPTGHQPQSLHPPLPTHGPEVASYNPFYNPNVDASAYNNNNFARQQQAPPAHPQQAYPQAPTHAPAHNGGYNPFHNPHVPAHLYQNAPTHAPAHNPAPVAHHSPSAVPTHASSPGAGYNPFYNPDIQNYNPFKNPNVPDHLYSQHQSQHNNNQYNHHAPAPAAPAPAGQFPAGTFSGGQFGSFSHPNSIPGAPQHKSGGGQVAVSQQNNGFTYNYQTS